jgi:hypothetical protein
VTEISDRSGRSVSTGGSPGNWQQSLKPDFLSQQVSWGVMILNPSLTNWVKSAG